MAMPPLIVRQKMRERLKNLDGNSRIREVRKIMGELAGYKSGDYGELRKELADELAKSHTRQDIRAVDFFAVKRDGDFQVGFVGQPSSGKSSIIAALSGARIKTADYAFTTLKPQSIVVRINDLDFQLLDLPGLIEAAAEGKGLGMRILGVVRDLDAIAYVLDVSQPSSELRVVMEELRKVDIDPAQGKPSIIIANKIDRLDAAQRAGLDARLAAEFPGYRTVRLSATEKTNLDDLQTALWDMSGFIRIYSREDTGRAFPMRSGTTIGQFAEHIHQDFVAHFRYARIWGPSAKFDGQKVGLEHVLADTDVVELNIEKF